MKLEKTCIGCGKTKHILEFEKTSKSPDGYRDRCKPCDTAYRKKLHGARVKKYRSLTGDQQ